ncbi:MAG: type II toxin-antitoxin system PemK/MazF family toxin [Patescibacteria group bacterium]
MQKDFDRWHQKKKEVHNYRPRVFFKEREIWFCHLGENVGFEQDGRGQEFLRPVIVLKKFNNEIFWALPLTKNKKQGRYYFSFKMRGENSTIILSQIRLIDAKRLKYKMGDIGEGDFVTLKTKIRQLLA